MRNDKHIAKQFRKQGESYNAISKKLGIQKSTLSTWFSELGWSQSIKYELSQKAYYIARKRLRLINKKRSKMWERWREEARKDAIREFAHLKRNPLFLAGLMLYWGEGDNKIENGRVRLTNTDPEMIQIFSRFLRNICNVSKENIRPSMILYPDLDQKNCLEFWSKASGIAERQFYKTQFIIGRHLTRRLANGICTIHISSRQLKEKIFTWRKLYKQELMRV